MEGFWEAKEAFQNARQAPGVEQGKAGGEVRKGLEEVRPREKS